MSRRRWGLPVAEGDGAKGVVGKGSKVDAVRFLRGKK